jgi:hypothetical protein
VIARILGHGQVELEESAVDHLNTLDIALAEAVDSGDENSFRQALVALTEAVKSAGRPLPDDALVPSDIVLPDPDASIEEVRELLGDEGLIPG